MTPWGCIAKPKPPKYEIRLFITGNSPARWRVFHNLFSGVDPIFVDSFRLYASAEHCVGALKLMDQGLLAEAGKRLDIARRGDNYA